MRRCLVWASLLLMWVGAPREICGQQAVAAPDASVEAALESLASRSAVIFVGQVTAIERHTGVVEIVFRVDRPVLGQVGATYTLREWAGLWPPGQWRYTVGERAMVFLHASSGAGFSSAVDGGEGVVPVVGTADGTPLLDIRRLSTRVLRQVGDPLPSEANGAIALEDAIAVVTNGRRRGLRPPVRRGLPEKSVSAAPAPGVPLHPGTNSTGGERGRGDLILRGVDDLQ